MQTPDAPVHPTIVKLSCPSKLVAAVPLLLGYLPSDSLIILAEAAADGDGLLVVRVDLPPAVAAGDWLAQMVSVVIRNRPARASLVCWTAAEPPTQVADLPSHALLRELASRLAEHAVMIGAALSTNGRWIWCHGCAEPECRTTGSPLLPDCAAEVEGALAGTVGSVLPSRRAVAELLAADPELRASVERELANCDASKSSAARDAAVAWLSHRWLAQVPEPGRASPGELAALIVALFDRRVRDVLVVRLARASNRGAPRLSVAVSDLLAAVRSCPPELAAPVASLLGLLIWFGGGAAGIRAEPGGGVLASEALGIARSADPDYTFARLVEATIQSGEAPDRWMRGLAEVSEAKCLAGDEAARPGRRHRRSA